MNTKSAKNPLPKNSCSAWPAKMLPEKSAAREAPTIQAGQFAGLASLPGS